MKIKIGDCFPEVTLFFLNGGKPEKVRSTELFNNKKIVLVSVPGAFTPTCSNDHLPGYIKNIERMKTRSVFGALRSRIQPSTRRYPCGCGRARRRVVLS